MNICRDCVYHRLENYTKHICIRPEVQRIDYISGNPITILCESIRKFNASDCSFFETTEGTTK